MTPEDLFLYRHRRLGELLDRREVVAMPDLAAILRQLLLDGTPLVDVVNRTSRVAITIRAPRSTIDTVKAMADAGLPEMMALIKSDLPDRDKAARMSRKTYLKHTMIMLEGRHYTVKDIIKACANRLGGVHYEVPEKDDPDVAQIRALNERMRIGDAPVVFRVLHSIAAEVHEALVPLRAAVETKCGTP